MVFFLFQCDIESEGDTKVRRIVYTGNCCFDCVSTICFLFRNKLHVFELDNNTEDNNRNYIPFCPPSFLCFVHTVSHLY